MMKSKKLMLIFIAIITVLFVGAIPACLPDSKGHSIGLKYIKQIENSGIIENYCNAEGVSINGFSYTATNGVFFSSGTIHLNLYVSKKMSSYEDLENYFKEEKEALNIKRKVRFSCYVGRRENRVLQYQNDF